MTSSNNINYILFGQKNIDANQTILNTVSFQSFVVEYSFNTNTELYEFNIFQFNLFQFTKTFTI